MAVQPGSPGAEAGLRAGDVIQEINRKRIQHPRELNQVLDQERDRPVVVLVLRGGRTLYVVIPPR